ncbi:MAG: hypothetical protein ACREBB_10730 [Nitrosotalea sp.]
MVELEGQIRLLGTIQKSSELQIGQELILETCDYDGNEKFVFKIQKNI